MTIVTISPKFQIVIPRPIRDSLGSRPKTISYFDPAFPGKKYEVKNGRLLGVRPSHKVRMILYQDRIELIPFKPIQETRGFLKGIDTTVEREPDRL
jgi:bifunctional DNA-binding transcriptional regulator/antitoxin component of YhaV-PrlF toxin-antitoxin module